MSDNDHSLIGIERRLRLVETAAPVTAVRTIERIVEKAPAAAKPSAWRFEVVRGADNLITEIIAEPIA